MHFQSLLGDQSRTKSERLALFALLNLGVIESVASGTLTATEAVRLAFHGENCRFVRRHLKEKAADEIMSHGVQLPDLFDALPGDEAHRELRHELEVMRALCLKLLAAKHSAA